MVLNEFAAITISIVQRKPFDQAGRAFAWNGEWDKVKAFHVRLHRYFGNKLKATH
ncbi:hypothetical protein D3C71_2105170 [compost metagenome]